MSYLTTGLDLKQDALYLAGEPIDGTSQYDAPNGPVYEWLTVVARAIVSGGMFGPSFLEPADWYWARAWPRGALQLVQPYNRSGATAATFTSGSTAITLVGSPTTLDLRGYRLLKTDTPARHIIASNAGLAVTLREPW